MQVSKANISQFLASNNVCFVIPVYQRNYDWKEDNCKQLWDDIWYLTRYPDNTHFLGTICSSGVISHEMTIIDGQQRITTVTLLIKAMHDCAKDPELKRDLKNTYLCNTGYGIPAEHKVKLQLNTRDDRIYNKLLNSDTFTSIADLEEQMVNSRLYQNYLYFYETVKNFDADMIQNVMAALEKLIIVELNTENEDPQEIFESLNSTGLDLTDVDLIRNYLLMSLERETQRRLYDSYWYPIEENVGTDNMVRFFVDYYIYSRKSDSLMYKGRKAHISVGHLYYGFKEHYKTLLGKDSPHHATAEVTEELLTDMLRCSKLYKRLVFNNRVDMNNLNEIDRIIYSIVYLNEAISTRPILMYITELSQSGKINDAEATEMFNACLSMIFRSKVTKSTGMSGQFVGNMLLRLSTDENPNILDKFWRAITAGRGDFAFPDDETFRYALFNKQIFDTLRSKGTKYLLYSLEQKSPSAKGLPRYDDPNLTIEHIMPKTLSPEWQKYLGDEAVRHSDFLNKLGNLALTNNNPEMSNDTFNEKRNWYSESSFHYTRKLATYENWSIEKIVERSKELMDKCVELWYFPYEYQQSTLDEFDDDSSQKNKKPPFRFSMIGLEEGDEVEYIEDRSIIATVVDDTHVLYKGDVYSLSGLVTYLRGSNQHHKGPHFFMYKGRTLLELREEKESYVN